jgi:hypothetical protein
MRKLTILALVATLAVAGSAMAAGEVRLGGDRFDGTFADATSLTTLPTTTNNDDSCDISVAPAATLLLPYFEVDIAAAAGTSDTTLFTITNVSRLPQIAHVTLWTDWSFPILDFNIFLTGFDVQSINLYDVIARGLVAPGGPGTSATSKAVSPTGGAGSNTSILPALNTANPNIVASAVVAGGVCSVLPGTLPAGLVAAVQTALTTGLYNPGVAGVGCGAVRVGGTHANAIGYVTIDVANTCSINLPDNPAYIATELLFDNVLIGDYQQLDGDPVVGNFAQGNPLVHIRATPEGGPAGSNPGTTLPYTFYDRYTFGAPITVPTRTFDRRQPLPSTFAARWIEGGTGGFNTDYKIWREGFTVGTQACATAVNNSNMPVADVVRFDERENAFGFAGSDICSPCGPGEGPRLPETSRTSTAAAIYPDNTGTDIGGWMYLNLNNGGSANYSASRPGFAPAGSATVTRASQNWAIVSMFAQGRYSVDFDAAWLGNGCSPAAIDPATSTSIGPAGGVLVCPPGVPAAQCTPGVGAFVGTNVTP